MAAGIKLALVAGARPNFMKIASLIRAIRLGSDVSAAAGKPLQYILVHTGQHYDANMSEIFFEELSIPAPGIYLRAGSGSHASQTAQVMVGFEAVCLREQPDWVVVVGDVNSTMACALAAAKLGIKVAHVEAGLRSYDRSMPEEINRVVTDALADLLFTPSSDANENLRKEGVPEAKIRFVGNIMIDALVANLERGLSSGILKSLGVEPKSFAYITLHRPSNVDSQGSLMRIMEELKRLADYLTVVFPMHPRTRKMLAEFNISWDGNANLKALEPIGYHDSIALAANARFVLTDSGGLQEETTFLRTPCLTLRPNTERPITITMGSNKLTSLERLSDDIQEALDQREAKGQIPPLWDGKTAERILESFRSA